MAEKPTYEELKNKIRELKQKESERKLAEDFLKESKERYRLLTQYSLTGIYIHIGGTFKFVNDFFAKMLGYSPEEMIGKTYWDFVHPDDCDMVRDISLARARGEDVVANYEFRHITRDGMTMWVRNMATIIQFEGQIANMGNLVNITERKLTEALLQESEEKYKELIEGTDDLVIKIDKDGNLLFANDIAKNIFGFSRENIIGKSAFDFIHPDDQERTQNWFRDCIEKSTGKATIENRQINKISGKTSYVLWNSNFKYDKEGQLKEVNSIAHDITERKQTEEALQESAEYHQELFTKSPTALFLQDFSTAGTCIEKLKFKGVGDLNTYFQKNPDEVAKLTKSIVISKANKAAIDLFDSKTSANLMQNLNQVLIKSDSQHFIDQIISFTSGIDWYEGEARNRTLKGKIINIIVRKMVINRDKNGLSKILVSLTDVSDLLKAYQDKEEMESHLQQAQKMESIGTLAGGIAHDFNNILFPIIGHAEMLLEDVPEGSPFQEGLNEIFSGALRAKDLVKQILTFSRQENSELKLMKLQPIIKEALKLIRSTIPTTIEIKQDLNADCGVIKADPTQIHQIVMNLATNAYHAMEETGGELKVSLKEVELGEYNIVTPDMTPGVYACLIVADTGAGMDKNLTDKIFDPFFTTKAIGKGTGMGLSVVHGIVKSVGGAVQVYSKPGKGTEFHVYLPIEKKSFIEQNIQAKESIQGGTEKILLVDDEAAILSMETLMLERLGYQVTSRTSSLEALEAFKVNPNKFDLVITDMAMPNMPGDKFAIELIKIRPDIPILLCTGFSETRTKEKIESYGIKGFILKPIVMKEFGQKIRAVLDSN